MSQPPPHHADAPHPWLDDQSPHDPDYAARQIDGLLAWFADRPHRLLDLGCGVGRVMTPLLEAGHDVVGLERREIYVAEARDAIAEAGLAERARIEHADFLAPWPLTSDSTCPFDAALCLGNTLMAVVDPDEALAFFQQAASRLAPGGLFIVDDFPTSSGRRSPTAPG